MGSPGLHMPEPPRPGVCCIADFMPGQFAPADETPTLPAVGQLFGKVGVEKDAAKGGCPPEDRLPEAIRTPRPPAFLGVEVVAAERRKMAGSQLFSGKADGASVLDAEQD